MSSAKRSPRNLGSLVLLVCLAGVLAFSVPGCSPGGTGPTLSPEAQAKAKANFKKRFGDDGAKPDRKSLR